MSKELVKIKERFDGLNNAIDELIKERDELTAEHKRLSGLFIQIAGSILPLETIRDADHIVDLIMSKFNDLKADNKRLKDELESSRERIRFG